MNARPLPDHKDRQRRRDARQGAYTVRPAQRKLTNATIFGGDQDFGIASILLQGALIFIVGICAVSIAAHLFSSAVAR